MRDKTSSSEAACQEEELSAAFLPDKRLAHRLRRLLDQMSAAPGKPIPAACATEERKRKLTRFVTPRVVLPSLSVIIDRSDRSETVRPNRCT